MNTHGVYILMQGANMASHEQNIAYLKITLKYGLCLLTI